MQAGALDGVIDRLRQTVLAQNGGDLSDGQLLELFVVRQDEAAFTALLRRHGPMVLSVCRRVAGNGHDAEDAFQTTFLLLVRKAAALRSRELVGPWLHGVARRTALKARTAQARRRRIESQAGRERIVPAAVDDGQDLRSLIDDAVHRLPDHYRVPVVLCELEGRSRREVARQLRVPEGTLASRLAKARRLLARRLARPGTVLTGASLTLLASPEALPASLVHSTTQAAARAVAGQAVSAASWMEGVLKIMTLHKFATTAVVLVTVGLLGMAVGLFPGAPGEPSAQAFAEDKKEKKEQGPIVHGRVQAVDTGKKSLTITVQVEKGKKQTAEKTYRVADDAKVYLADILEKKATLPEGTLADLSEGTGVDARLSVDGKSIVSITARGPGMDGGVKKFDKATNTLTFAIKGKDGEKEITVKLAKGAKVILDDGIGKKGDAPMEGTTDHLTERARAHIQLTVDRKTALGVRLMGGGLQGTLAGYDAGTRTLTVTVKEDGQVVDKTLPLVKDAKVEGDLTAGARVVVRLSVTDKEKAVGVRVIKDD